MKKTHRIVLTFYIGSIGLFMAYIFFDFIFNIIFLDYEFKFDYIEMFVLLISLIIVFSSALSLIYNIRIIKSYNQNYQVDNQYSNNAGLNPYKSNKLILIGNMFFSIATIILAVHILFGLTFLAGITSSILIMVASVIMRDAFKNRLTSENIMQTINKMSSSEYYENPPN